MGVAHPKFVEKTFAGGSQTVKFVKVFFFGSFPLYGTYDRQSLLKWRLFHNTVKDVE